MGAAETYCSILYVFRTVQYCIKCATGLNFKGDHRCDYEYVYVYTH
jgi:hypothetical protein